MASQPLAGEQRQMVLAAVWGALLPCWPDLFDRKKLRKPGGVMALDAHLDALVKIARRPTAGDAVEAELARVLDDICARCPQQGAGGFCALRHADECVLFTHARLILRTIGSALRELGDTTYLAARDGADRVA